MIEQQEIQKNLKTLKKLGVKRPKADNLARLSWVTDNYIKKHVHQAVEIEGGTLGLAIWRMEHKQELP